MSKNSRTVLVTGANQGIGLAIVKALAEEPGYTVYAGSRNLARGEAACQDLRGDVRPIQLDVTDQASIDAAARRVGDEVGSLDVLINNAAISHTRKILDITVEEFSRISKASMVPIEDVRAIWDTNVFGVLALTQAVVPLLRKAPYARIVNVSSGVGSLTLNSDPNTDFRSLYAPGYAASKTALNGITLAFAIEFENTSIKVHAVTPGFTKTNLNNYEGTETVEQGAAEAVRVALLGPEGPTGTFTHATMGSLPW